MTDTLERREAEQRLRNMILTIAIAAKETPASDDLDDFASMADRIVKKLTTSPRVDEGRARVERDDLLSTLIYVSTALPVLRTMLSAIHADKAEAQADTMIRLVQEAIDRTDTAALATTPADPRVGKIEADLEAAASVTYAVQHNPNCPSPYLVRLPRGCIDFKPPASSNDAIGYGKTFTEAFNNARSTLSQIEDRI